MLDRAHVSYIIDKHRGGVTSVAGVYDEQV
jgi:hypothetical protein